MIWRLVRYGRRSDNAGMQPTGHKVSPNRLEEFRGIYKARFGEEITTAEATEITGRLLALYRLLMRPLPSERALYPPEPPRPAQNAHEAS